MRKNFYLKTLVAFIALTIGIANVATSQTVFTIGDSIVKSSATNYPTPYGDYYKTMRTQFLYHADELVVAGMGAGDITEIIFWVSTPAFVGDDPGLTEGVTVSMKNTETSSLAAGTWESDAEPVWGPYDNDPVSGAWNTFTLDVPFYWDGSSNLLIEICGGSDLGGYTDNGEVAITTGLAFNGSRTYRTDGFTEGGICGYSLTLENGTATSRPVIRLMGSEGDACTGTPDAGMATSSAESVCVDEIFTVSIPATLGAGITYQWEVSTDGISWAGIIGATSSLYGASQTEASWYHCIVTCTESGESSTSEAVYVGQNAATDCYCEPVYLTGTSDGDYCSYVGLGSIDNPTDGADAPFYTYYSDMSTDLITGFEYTLEATTGLYDALNGLAAWIDFNKNGSFEDEGEFLGSSTGLGSFTSAYFVFTVPVDAEIGTTRLRVREIFNMSESPSPCAEASFGETEDYNVNIMGGGDCFPAAPTDIYADGITATTATIHWTIAPGTSASRLVVWELSTGKVVKYIIYDGDSFTVPGELSPSTTYGARLKSGCLDGEIWTPGDYSEWYYFTTDPLREGEFLQSVSVFPNPNKGNFRIQLNGYESGKAQVMIMNAVGQLMYDATISIDANASVHDVSLNLAAGTYIVKVINGSEIVTNTIIVE
ncbi:MAG: T9SS type A sorting domain-containing protein [Bacteroidetes bacterium]|nr:T9SS type A sorting domain-containing protein [Bacteroidota bacterium]